MSYKGPDQGHSQWNQWHHSKARSTTDAYSEVNKQNREMKGEFKLIV